MTVTIYTTGDPFTIEGEYALEALLMLELPMKSPWLKVKTKYGMQWIDREHITSIAVSE